MRNRPLAEKAQAVSRYSRIPAFQPTSSCNTHPPLSKAMATNPENRRPGNLPQPADCSAPSTKHSRFRLCNAFHIDRHSFPGFSICTFGAVAADEVIFRWTFAFESRFIAANRVSLLGYLAQVRKQVEVGPFTQPTVPISKPLLLPRPVDFIGVARQDRTAEIVFHGWSWHTTTSIVADPKEAKLIHATLYVMLRRSLELQISWITELYDSAHIPKDQCFRSAETRLRRSQAWNQNPSQGDAGGVIVRARPRGRSPRANPTRALIVYPYHL